ncbi:MULTISPECIES: hypothetical protein [Microbispora]|nr:MULTISPECIES: hypothetical protein [unclassified Microbispora]
MPTDSSSVIRSAGSAGSAVPPPRPPIHSVRSGSGSGTHSPT